MRRPTFAGITVVAGLLALSCGPVLAQGTEGEDGGMIALVVLLVVVGIIPPLQLVVASLLPAFTLRTARAIRTSFWPSAGWGALVVVLVAVAASILSQGGKAGQGVAIALGVAATLLAVAGCIGVAKHMGDWSLRRWRLASPGPLSVLIGAVMWSWGALVPVLGWLAGLLTLFASLGAAVQVILHPRHFDEASALPPAIDRIPDTTATR